MVPGFSRQHLCNRDLTKVRVPEIRSHDPEDSRLPNPFLAQVRGNQRASQPLHNTRNTPPHRGAGHAIVPERTPGAASRCAQWRCRAPPGSAMRSAFPATRQAAGARSVRSQPFRRPSRDRADRATLGRQRRPRRPVPIEPRGPAAGNPTKPDRPALSRIRPTVFNVSDGQAGSPPPQCPPNLVWTRNRGRPRAREKPRPIGVPGTPLCWNHHPAPPRAPHNGATGLPREARCGLFFRLRGRPPAYHRRGRSPPRLPRATTPMVRRWVAGTPMRHGDPEGRCRGHGPRQRQRPGQGPYPYPWAMEPTRVGTPPSPARRRRCKHRSAQGIPAPRHAPHEWEPGTPLEGPYGQSIPAQKEAAARAISVVDALPVTTRRPR